MNDNLRLPLQEKKLRYWKNFVSIAWAISLLLFIVLVLIFIFNIKYLQVFFSSLTVIYILAIILSLLCVILIANGLIKKGAACLNKRYLSRFNFDETTDTYPESAACYHLAPKNKNAKAVLLIHGMSVSPQEFCFLTPYLQKNNILYFAPELNFFLTDANDIKRVPSRKFWYQAVLEKFDMLSQLADNVSILGHSLGACLAANVAGLRRVDQLILSGPWFYLPKSDFYYKHLLKMPILNKLLMTLIPFAAKPIRQNRLTETDILDTTNVFKMFQYLAMPTQALREVFLLQDEVDLTRCHCNAMHLLYGKHDVSVDMAPVFETLNKNHIRYYEKCYLNSAHGILEDYERKTVCEDIVKILISD